MIRPWSMIAMLRHMRSAHQRRRRALAHVAERGAGRQLTEIELVEILAERQIGRHPPESEQHVVADLHRRDHVEQVNRIGVDGRQRDFIEVQAGFEEGEAVVGAVGFSGLPALQRQCRAEFRHRVRQRAARHREIDYL